MQLPAAAQEPVAEQAPVAVPGLAAGKQLAAEQAPRKAYFGQGGVVE